MTKEERHNLILDYLMQNNSVLVSELAMKLNVSSVTIRKDLTELEKAGCTDLDALCNCFGALLGAVFCYRQDLWGAPLDRMGRGLGGFIYLMDAYDDLPKDRKHGRFNALAATADAYAGDRDGYESRCHELLTQQMGLCAQGFGVLPILRDTPEGQLLHNTIYAGVWSKYALVKAARARPRARKGTQNQ